MMQCHPTSWASYVLLLDLSVQGPPQRQLLVHMFLHCCTGWVEGEESFPSAPSLLCRLSEATVQHLHLGRKKEVSKHKNLWGPLSQPYSQACQLQYVAAERVWEQGYIRDIYCNTSRPGAWFHYNIIIIYITLYLLHCLSLALRTTLFMRTPPSMTSFCPSMKQSLHGGERPWGTTSVRGE